MVRTASFDRDDLVTRARDLFWRQGWAGTSLKDLELTLGVRPGSFYAAFGSKDALYAETLDIYAADGAKRLDGLAKENGPLGTLKAHVLSFAGSRPFGAAHACMLVKTLLEVQGRQGDLAKQASRLLEEMEIRFAALFSAAQIAGDVAKHHDPARLARRYQSDLIGLRASAERPDVDAAELAREIAAGLDALQN
ncbi:TetR/AcrR family transcriptional regulator [Aestuariibius insulae]|uniref:TetR/AcrR family transcriptional regulator n=1 Tax=Aestuariibius insulae TaxID=2058287 RepID=UPI00345E47B4